MDTRIPPQPAPVGRRTLTTVAALLCCAATLAWSGPVEASTRVTTDAGSALDRSWSAGVYGTAWGGSYNGLGTGGVLRWELFPGTLGVEVFGTRAQIDWPDAKREDDVGGFAIYTPFRLTDHLRLKLGGGFCAMLSKVDPRFPGGPRDDAMLLGTHASAAVDWALGSWVSLFAQTRAFAYRGRDRTVDSVTAQGTLAWQPALQGDVGLSFHFGT